MAMVATGSRRRPPRCLVELLGPDKGRPLTMITLATGELVFGGPGSAPRKSLTEQFADKSFSCPKTAGCVATTTESHPALRLTLIIRRMFTRKSTNTIQDIGRRSTNKRLAGR